MNLAQGKQLVIVSAKVNDEIAKEQGAKRVYQSGLHVSVPPVDFERAIEEEWPNKSWQEGEGTHVQHRFANWKTPGGMLTFSCSHDYLVE